MAKPFKPVAPAPQSPPSAAVSAAPARTTEVRNSPIPRATSPAPQQQRPQGKPVTHDQIARKAYEIWQSGKGGSEFENWVRAERELRGS